jgi:hypothetical protein
MSHNDQSQEGLEVCKTPFEVGQVGNHKSTNTICTNTMWRVEEHNHNFLTSYCTTLKQSLIQQMLERVKNYLIFSGDIECVGIMTLCNCSTSMQHFGNTNAEVEETENVVNFLM